MTSKNLLLKMGKCIVTSGKIKRTLTDVYIPITTNLKMIALDQTINAEKVVIRYANDTEFVFNKKLPEQTYSCYYRIQKAKKNLIL